MLLSFVFLFFFFGIMYLFYFFANEYTPLEKEMDWTSYLLAKTAKLYLPNPFANTTASIARMRKLYDMALIYPNNLYISKYPELQKISDGFVEVKIPVEEGEISARIYNARRNEKQGPLKPVLVWYHGGGMVIGSMAGAHGNAVKLANHTGFLVVNVDYRLAPEFIFPTPLEDAYTAFLWVEREIERFGGDARRLTIGGDSAGGYLATTITARYLASFRSEQSCEDNGVCFEDRSSARSSIVGLLNVYPGLNATSETEEALLYGKSSGILTTETVRQFRAIYQGSVEVDESIRQNYLFSPLLTSESLLSLFPPTVFVLAQFDPLVVEGLVFRQKLEALGIPTYLLKYNTIHGFFGDNLIAAGNEAIAASSLILAQEIVYKKV